MPQAHALHSLPGGPHKGLLKNKQNNDEVMMRKNAVIQALLTAGLIASAPLASAALADQSATLASAAVAATFATNGSKSTKWDQLSASHSSHSQPK